MEKIILGLELTKQSEKTLIFTFKIAQHFNSKINIVNVLSIDDPELYDRNQSSEKFGKVIMEEYRQEQIAKVEEFVNNHLGKQFHDLDIEVTVEYGEISEEIIRIAVPGTADLIVVSRTWEADDSHNQNITQALIQKSKIPLLVIPEEASFKAINRIIYATDFMLEDCGSILFFEEWLQLFEAKLICLHLNENEVEKEKSTSKINILRRLFPSEKISFRSIIFSDIEHGIDRYVELSGAEIVSTYHRKRGLWDSFFKSSITKAIAKDTKVPLLVFKDGK